VLVSLDVSIPCMYFILFHLYERGISGMGGCKRKASRLPVTYGLRDHNGLSFNELLDEHMLVMRKHFRLYAP
jgi:hypothetical protein